MSTTVNNYAAAIVTGDIQNIAATLSPSVKVLPPGSNQANEGTGKTSMMLSSVAAVVSDFKLVRIYSGENGWATVLLEGLIEDTPVQFIDQVHVDSNEQIDHVDIFLRPAAMAQSLLARVTEEIQRRTSK